MQAELSNLLAANSQGSIDAPMGDLHQPADECNGHPDPDPLIAARHEAATRDPAKIKTGSAGAQHKLASLAAEHTAAAGQSSGEAPLLSKPLAETASLEAITSYKTQTYTNTAQHAVKAAPANSPAAEGPACKHTKAGLGRLQPEPPIVPNHQPHTVCQSSSANSGSACTDSALKTACTVRVSPAESDPSAAQLSQCGPDEAAVLIESLNATIPANVMPAKPQCKTHGSKPRPLVNAFTARCGSGSSTSKDKSGGPPCYPSKHANPASARSDFASTSGKVELGVDQFMQIYFGKPPQAKPIKVVAADH